MVSKLSMGTFQINYNYNILLKTLINLSSRDFARQMERSWQVDYRLHVPVYKSYLLEQELMIMRFPASVTTE